MKTEEAKRSLSDLLSLAGIKINGNQPWDIKVYNDAFYEKALVNGSLGVGEAFIEKWWEVSRLDEFFSRVLKADLDKKVQQNGRLLSEIFLTKIFNRQTRLRAFRAGEKHYDLGNDL